MSGRIGGSGSASAKAVFDRTVKEAVRQSKLTAQHDPTFVPQADDAGAVLAAQIFGRRATSGDAGRHTLTFDTYLQHGAASYDGTADATLSTNATDASTASTLAARDSSGNIKFKNVTSNVTATTGKYLFGDSGTATLTFDGTNFAFAGGGFNAPAIVSVAGFGCNGQSAQTAHALGSAATDLPSVIALANAIRDALRNNGIGS